MPNDANARAPYQPLLPVLIAVCLGIVSDRNLQIPPFLGWSVAATALIAWFCLWKYQRLGFATLCILLSAMMAASAWHHLRWQLFSSNEIGRAAARSAEPACLEGIALSSPRRIPPPPYNPMRTLAIGDRSRLPLIVTAVRDGAKWRSSSGSVTLLVDGTLTGIRSGDRIRVFGRLAEVPAASNPGEFSLAQHLRAERVLAQVRTDYHECITVVDQGNPWRVGRLIDSLRTSGHGLLWQNLNRQRAGLAAAMFLGIREELDEEANQAFLETGTVYLLVISGLNVGILAGAFYLLHRLGLLSLPVMLLLTAGLTVVYAIVTDAQPPVVRAAVMVVIACIAKALGRQSLDWNTLAAAALVVLVLNPCELFRAGTQLSFLSVAALLFVHRNFWKGSVDPLDRLIAASRPAGTRAAGWLVRWTWRATVTSAVIWLVVLPLVMARFHLVSPSAVLLGPILGAPVALAMLCGFVVLLLGWIFPPLGALSGWICDGCLAALELSVNAARNLSGSHFWVSGPSDLWLAGFYLALGAVAFWPQLRPSRRWATCLAGAWIAGGLYLPSGHQMAPLECTVLSVGHGLSTVIHTPDGRNILYDPGRLGSPLQPARAVTGYLWDRGITHLDAVIISHADADHYNALPEILERISVGVVYVSPMMFDEPRDTLTALKRAIEAKSIPIRTVYAGDRLRTDDDCQIEVLHPPRLGVLGEDNANSIVLNIECAGRRVLLTGDLETPGLETLLAEEPIDCDVLLAPHHGSRLSDPIGLAEWATPEFVVVSGGERDAATEVRAAYEPRRSTVFHTHESGAVTFVVSLTGVTTMPFDRASDP